MFRHFHMQRLRADWPTGAKHRGTYRLNYCEKFAAEFQQADQR